MPSYGIYHQLLASSSPSTHNGVYSQSIFLHLPAFFFTILVRILSIVANARNSQHTPLTPSPIFVLTSILLTNLYLLIFITDPTVIMRNQDAREVMETITAKLCPGIGKKRIRVASTSNDMIPAISVIL